MFIRFIPILMVLIASIITLLVSIFNDFEIIFSLKILAIVIILFYIIGNIVKVVLSKIMDMDKEVNEDKAEDERAEQDDNTAVKSGDNDSQ